MDTMVIKLGFKINNVFFGWYRGDLYQLPYTLDGRYYGLRKLRLKKLKNSDWEYYHVCRKKFGISKIRAILQEVNWEVNKPVELLNK